MFVLDMPPTVGGRDGGDNGRANAEVRVRSHRDGGTPTPAAAAPGSASAPGSAQGSHWGRRPGLATAWGPASGSGPAGLWAYSAWDRREFAPSGPPFPP